MMIAKRAKSQAGTVAVGYVRRSTDRQEQSIGDQKKALQEYATENGLRLKKFYVDDAISGTSTIGRRAFQQMMTDAQKTSRPFDRIVVYDVKRFGRVDNDEAGYYRHVPPKDSEDHCPLRCSLTCDSTPIPARTT
ncbi:MAG TPA: recombinase family protein [Phycisphaerae bacterium]|nr:recombinase family protein [Phycisphaerae bacterium]HDZ45188.1 recombinase family protein [Phycisphaerae bacterium]